MLIVHTVTRDIQEQQEEQEGVLGDVPSLTRAMNNDITFFRLLQIRMRYQLTTLDIPLYSVMLTVMELKSSSWACHGLVTIVVLSEYISVRLKSVLLSCTKN